MISLVKDVWLDGPVRRAGGSIQRALGHVSVGIQHRTGLTTVSKNLFLWVVCSVFTPLIQPKMAFFVVSKLVPAAPRTPQFIHHVRGKGER